jgi:hypothetical protein
VVGEVEEAVEGSVVADADKVVIEVVAEREVVSEAAEVESVAEVKSVIERESVAEV